MDYFEYKNGTLVAEDVKVSKIANEIGTPFYCYSATTIEYHFKALKKVI